jgi:hypothetical protein
MKIPFVIDNRDQKLADVLNYLLGHFQSRSERSRLAPESQPIQDAIDAVLFRCYGLSEDDARYVEARLTEML